MLNNLTIYRELGVKAASAQNVGDAASVVFYRDQFNRCLQVESIKDKTACRNAFDGGWRDARKV